MIKYNLGIGYISDVDFFHYRGIIFLSPESETTVSINAKTNMASPSVVANAAQKVVSFALAGASFLALSGISFNIYMNTGKNRKRRTNLVDTTTESATTPDPVPAASESGTQ